MGFFANLFKRNKSQTPQVQSLMPAVAVQEIKNGRLPIIQTDTLLLKNKEALHYADKAILLKEKRINNYRSNRFGISFPGLFKGTRIHFGDSYTKPIERVETQQFEGVLYITNKRMIFVNKANGFEKQLCKLSAVTPYSNGIECQFGGEAVSFILAEGIVAYKVINLII